MPCYCYHLDDLTVSSHFSLSSLSLFSHFFFLYQKKCVSLHPIINPKNTQKMKLQGFVGKGSGKLGASVWVVRKGQQVVREYTAHVSNPKSTSQAHQRAKFKLMSQVTALLAPAMVNRPVGSESVRNAFTRENAALVVWDNEGSRAKVDMLQLSLTSSSLGLPGLSSITAAPDLAVSLSSVPFDAIDAVMYIAIAKMGDNYEFVDSELVSDPGSDNHYGTTLHWPSASVSGIVYAYGLKWTSQSVRTLYESYKADPVHSASLVLQLLRAPSNAVFTLTRAREVVA